MDVIYVFLFGKLLYVYVIVDIYLYFIWVICQIGESIFYVKKYLLFCFVVMGVLEEIKIDNGLGYYSKVF